MRRRAFPGTLVLAAGCSRRVAVPLPEEAAAETAVLTGTVWVDEGLKSLINLKGLHTLNIGKTEVTSMKHLRVLDNSKSSVTDSGLKELRALTGLEELWWKY